MLTHWNKLVLTDCRVVDVGGQHFYPIFKNGSSSLISQADSTLVNEQIADCSNINVFVRDPVDRFVSGINEYCQQNNLDLESTYKLVEHNEITDRHFAPQWIWLVHLSKHYKSDVTLLPFSDISKYCGSHNNKRNSDIKRVEPIETYIKQDKAILKHLGETLNIKKLIRICKDGLSKT